MWRLIDKNIRGETMIEVAIILSIIVVMSTLLYANYHDINKKGDVLRASEGLKNELRRAQNYSLNHQADHGYVFGWGVYVNRLLNQYVTFADKDNNLVYSYPTKLLIHGTELDSGTSFMDSAHTGQIVTVGNNATQRDNMGQPDDSDGYWNFDGEGDFLSVPNSEAVNFGSHDFVIDFWFRSDAQNVGRASLIYKWGDVSTEQAWNCYKQDNLHRIVCTVKDIDDSSYVLTSTPTVAEQWYHLALVRRGQTLSLYLDGEQQEVTPMTLNIKSTSSDIIIGAYSDESSFGWSGDIDEIRIANGMSYWDGNFANALPTQLHTADDEAFKRTTLPPGIIMKTIIKNSLPANDMSLYFSRDDFHLYLDGLPSVDAVISIDDVNETLDARNIHITPSGLVELN